MEVILFFVKFAGPLLLAGLFVLGWMKLWSRPEYVFALIYSVGIYACFVFVDIFAGWPAPYVIRGADYIVRIERHAAWGFVSALAFFVPAAAIVAFRKRPNE